MRQCHLLVSQLFKGVTKILAMGKGRSDSNVNSGNNVLVLLQNAHQREITNVHLVNSYQAQRQTYYFSTALLTY